MSHLSSARVVQSDHTHEGLSMNVKDATAEVAFDEETRFALPDGRLIVDMTSDGHAFWFEQLGSEAWRFTWDGRRGEPFTLVSQRDGRPFLRSPDRRHVAYYAVRGDAKIVGIDGREEGSYDAISRSVPPTFTADGRRYAYGVGIGKDVRLVVDGEVLTDSQPAATSPTWSPDGTRLAYCEVQYQVSLDDHASHRKPAPPQRIVIDGMPEQWFDAIGDQPGAGLFSPDSKHFAYAARIGPRNWFVIDGRSQQAFDDIGEPAWSFDSRRFAYAAITDGKAALVEDDRIRPSHWRVADITFSPDSTRLAYVDAAAEHRLAVVVDDQAGPEWFDLWGGPVFSPDSRRIAYIAKRRGSGLLGRLKTEFVPVIDGAVSDRFDQVSSLPHFSPDSRHVAFSAGNDKAWSMVIDGSPGASFERVGPPRYSIDGQLRYIVMAGGRQTIATDGRPGPWADEISEVDDIPFTVSPDGRHVAWVARRGGLHHPVVDEMVGPAFEGVGAGAFIDDRVRFGCIRGSQYLVVTAQLGS
jgi:hypothetical protein